MAGRADKARERSTARRRQMLKRTAKSCGSDAPRLASRFAEASRPNRALDKTISAGRRWQNSMVTEESTKETVKTIARGMPGDSGVTVVTMLVCFVLFRTRGCGCSERPAFPAPSTFFGRTVLARLGRIAPRDRERAFEICPRHCEERLVIHTPSFRDGALASTRPGISRFRVRANARPGMTAVNCFAEPVIGRAFARPVDSQ